MNIAPHHDSLCPHHLRHSAAAQPDPEALAAELLDLAGDLDSAHDVNILLCNLVKQLARKRIDSKDALAIGYLSQLLLSSLPAMAKESKAESDDRDARDLEKFFARARASFQAKRAAEEAAKAARTAPRNSPTTKDAAGAPPQPASQNTPATLEPGIPRPPRDYASMRT